MDRKNFLKMSIASAFGLGLTSTLNSCDNNTVEIECDATKACTTQCDEEGPFYKTVSNNNTDLTQIGPGDSATYTNQKVKIKISGRVLSGDNCDEPVSGAIVDIWHADPDGHYDVKESRPGRGDAVPDDEVQIVFRTSLITNDNGEYFYVTYQPYGYYDRPQHIHYKVNASGYKELVTQLYFADDPKLVPGNFSGGISQAEVDRITADRKVQLTDSTNSDIDKEGVFDIHIEVG
jgi:protocatechuate 3,4-dioxygenase beta subunit